MTEKELISKIQGLKQIKPRKNWVILVKSDIFGLPTQTGNNIIENKAVNKLNYTERLLNIFSPVFQRKFAYALAVFLFVFAGVFSFMKYGLPQDVKVVEQSPAALTSIKSNVETFKIKSQNLAQAVRRKSNNISLALNEVKDAAKELTNAIQKDPQLAKTVALDINNNKTYLDIPDGNDLRETSDALYKAIDSQMIGDLEKTTLTEDQQKTLDVIKDLYNQGKYSSALENILLINNTDSKK